MKALLPLNGQDIGGVAATDPVVAQVGGGTGIHAVALVVTAGTDFDLDIEVTTDGVNWVKFATVTEASTILAFQLGMGWPMVRLNCTDDTGGDVDVSWSALTVGE
jgi:hypothetical protein